jgi:hypothetical protein
LEEEHFSCPQAAARHWEDKCDQLKAENEKFEAEAVRLRTIADAWWTVVRIGREWPQFDDEEPLSEEDQAQIDEHADEYEAAKERAHKLDPGRRCPECKGQHGYVVYGGFAPCSYCDTNDWEEILEESKHEESYVLKVENARLQAALSSAIVEGSKRIESLRAENEGLRVDHGMCTMIARELEQGGTS